MEETSQEEAFKKEKSQVFYIKLPNAVSERLRRQAERLSCSMAIIGRMAVIKFLEEEEAREHNIRQSYGGGK